MNQNLQLLILLLGEASLFSGLERLHKTIYLIKSMNKESFSYSFIRANYGPFSHSIVEDLNFLIESKLIKSEYNIKTFEKTYKLTLIGYQHYVKIKSLINNDLLSQVNKMTLKMSNFSKSEYRDYVYSKAQVSDYEIGDQMNLIKT
jgi:hypothetical protein